MPPEVLAVYPHLADMPRRVWMRLFGSARREIDILAAISDTVIAEPGIRAALAERAQAEVAVRVCFLCPGPWQTGLAPRMLGRRQGTRMKCPQPWLKR